MFKEFREFIMNGNMIDLAVGIVIGAAFTAVVNSLVNDIIMPPIGFLMGGVDFTDLFISLDGQEYASLTAAQDAGAATINYGLFINSIIAFLVIGLVIFFIVKAVNRLRRDKEEEPVEPTSQECPYCLTEIPLHAHRCPNCTSQLEATAA